MPLQPFNTLVPRSKRCATSAGRLDRFVLPMADEEDEEEKAVDPLEEVAKKYAPLVEVRLRARSPYAREPAATAYTFASQNERPHGLSTG